MGIDWCGLEAILLSVNECTNKENVCMLGRQSININEIQVNSLLNRYSRTPLITNSAYSEDLFKHLGFKDCDSIDYSSYQGATIIHNMNKKLSSLFLKKYSFIFDGGTSEHIFNCPQVFQNIIDLLEVGGIVCSVVPNNNMSGHGMYQFSPEFFLSIFNEKYGMKEIKDITNAIIKVEDFFLKKNNKIQSNKELKLDCCGFKNGYCDFRK